MHVVHSVGFAIDVGFGWFYVTPSVVMSPILYTWYEQLKDHILNQVHMQNSLIPCGSRDELN